VPFDQMVAARARTLVRVWLCGVADYYEPVADRVRLDPLDAKTGRHAGECEYVSETDPAMIKVLLKVSDKEGYSWVECGACAAGWQVAHYSESVG
jgi:hypothetical protein